MRNQKGFSIMSAVIATAILSTISLGVAGILKNYHDLIARARHQETAKNFAEIVGTYMSDGVDCERILDGTTVDMAQVNAFQSLGNVQITGLNPDGTPTPPLYQTGSQLDGGLTIDSFQLRILIPDVNSLSGELHVVLEPPDGGPFTKSVLPFFSNVIDDGGGNMVIDACSTGTASPGGGGGSGEGEKCIVIEDLRSFDDDMPLASFKNAVTINSVWCQYHRSFGAPTTIAQIRLEDGSGNAVTHAPPICSAADTSPTPQNATAGNSFLANELLRFDVINSPNPSTDRYSICVGYTEN